MEKRKRLMRITAAQANLGWSPVGQRESIYYLED